MFPLMKVFQMWISEPVVVVVRKQVHILTTSTNFLPPVRCWGHVFRDEVFLRWEQLISLLSLIETSLFEVPFEYFYCRITLISNLLFKRSFTLWYSRFIATADKR